MLFKRKNGGVVEARNNYEASILMSNKDYTPFENEEKPIEEPVDNAEKPIENAENAEKHAEKKEAKASKKKDGE